MLPRTILANIFVVSHILLLFYYNELQNIRNLENISHIALGTVRQQLHMNPISINNSKMK